MLKKVYTVIIATLFLMTSGYSGTEFFFSNKATIVIQILLFFCCFALFIYYLPASKIKKEDIKPRFKRLFSFENSIVLFTLAIFAVSILANMFKGSNLLPTVRFLILFFSAAMIVLTVPFSKIIKVFCNTMFVVCLISISTFIIALSLGVDGSTNFSLSDRGAFISTYGYLIFFVNGWNTYHYGLSTSLRMCGPFWEPSIFAAMLIISMMLLIYGSLKNRKIYFIVYLICLILTFSTGGYILFAGVILLYLSFKIKSTKKMVITILALTVVVGVLFYLVMWPLLPYFIKWFPSIFEKLSHGGITSSIRYKSIYALFSIFKDNPIFGLGLNEARIQYSSLFSVDQSLTSTLGYLAASFGIPGIAIAGCAFSMSVINLKRRVTSNIIFAITFMLLVNLENMLMISVVCLVACSFVKNGLFDEETSFITCNKPRLGNLLFHSKDGKTNKNLVGLLAIKGLAMLIGLFTIPVYNSFFGDNEQYGIWAVILSVVSLTLIFDFGFGSGLRTRLTDAIERGDTEGQKKLISSTYVGSSVAGIIIFAVFEILILSLNLNSIFNIDADVVSATALKIAMSILAVGLSCEFILKNITFINYAEKKSILGSSYALISNFLLIVIFSVFRDSFSNGKMISAAVIYSLSVNLPLIIATIVHFMLKNNRKTSPSIRSYDWSTCKSVMSFGLLFFITQIGFAILTMTDSIFISNLYGPVYSGDYSKYQRIFIFFIGLMGSVVQQPIWSAVASSVNKKQYKDIRKYTKITLIISLVLFFFCLMFGLMLQPVFDLWLGNNTINVSYTIVIAFLIYSFVFLVSDAFIIIANGLKIIKIQAIIALIASLVKIAFIIIAAYIPAIVNFGWGFIVIVDAICYLPYIVILPLSIRKRNKELVNSEKKDEVTA